MALKKREFTPESGTVDTYELRTISSGEALYTDKSLLVSCQIKQTILIMTSRTNVRDNRLTHV